MDGMLTAFQIFHAKMPFTPTATASFSFSFLLHQDKGGGAERKGDGERENKLRFFKVFKVELYNVIFFKIKHIFQITTFEFVLRILKAIGKLESHRECMEARKCHKLSLQRRGLSVKVFQKCDYICIKKKKRKERSKYSDLVCKGLESMLKSFASKQHCCVTFTC